MCYHHRPLKENKENLVSCFIFQLDGQCSFYFSLPGSSANCLHPKLVLHSLCLPVSIHSYYNYCLGFYGWLIQKEHQAYAFICAALWRTTLLDVDIKHLWQPVRKWNLPNKVHREESIKLAINIDKKQNPYEILSYIARDRKLFQVCRSKATYREQYDSQTEEIVQRFRESFIFLLSYLILGCLFFFFFLTKGCNGTQL